MRACYVKYPDRSSAGPQPSASTEAPRGQPFLYSVAASLHAVLHLSREQQLAVWRRVLDAYAQRGRALPKFLQDLCQEAFVDALLENEVFWGLVGSQVSREFYARASDHLCAVYAAAALLAAGEDQISLEEEDRLLLKACVR